MRIPPLPLLGGSSPPTLAAAKSRRKSHPDCCLALAPPSGPLNDVQTPSQSNQNQNENCWQACHPRLALLHAAKPWMPTFVGMTGRGSCALCATSPIQPDLWASPKPSHHITCNTATVRTFTRMGPPAQIRLAALPGPFGRKPDPAHTITTISSTTRLRRVASGVPRVDCG